ncbi:MULTISPECIES: phosphopentomutase [unclassified Pseudodesulfovibrio]|uniref:phosphopentomutase n=1 Tax=unclassified Pseudodesulfovibrio TaxID=2661612 RepID=UPI000FEB749D|nr:MULTISPECIES: phosphopentomutase [unclassified Pseudodesulfovibrio]MCJ2165095.1 phosphopentomutase [Pseudodesulfovibrio sp. S3-i]RWU03440.1 phosphopentomutase [Pseudodesulfovibrio sp. S3]
MGRAFILVLDSLGIGWAPDADRFGDAGADTLGHIAEACTNGKGNREGVRSGPLHLPCMSSLGMGMAAQLVTGVVPPGLQSPVLRGRFAAAREISRGKDTPSGHWELAGVPVHFDWGYFPPDFPSFPAPLIDALIKQGNLPGILGNCHASGTEIIARLGQEHMESGKPICYTSADSVFQIAAHEKSFGLNRLLELCVLTRKLLEEYNIGRVIARPFVGEPGAFTRTPNRRDYSLPPPAPTLLDKLQEAGREVVSVGKIADIFAHQGLTKKVKAPDSDGLFDLVEEEVANAPDGSLTFANFVEFDSEWGHRRDVAGYAAALESMDKRISGLIPQLRPGDLAVITADHGCDPTWKGTDHTRECVPVLLFGPEVLPGTAGVRETFADVGQTVAAHLGIDPLDDGKAIPLR